ncbi:uncharacterized protein LOC111346100 [Stylophora pistillata]|uniref:uncharacterized protein LOC111346100 n=1 Tax=Stylophora pistillata TaxID=50429 RepID=UPI000C03F6F8|nr:uncharacterized protein LOC111346100 [Stylophora pistillata]
MELQKLKVACAILICLVISQNIIVLRFEVIQDNGCRKVLLQKPNQILTEKGELNRSNVGVGYAVCAKICGWWSCSTYYCPGDRICCWPGNANSKCCPADHPLCVSEGCCPEGYPKVCGRYCCDEDSFCCNGENCCTNEEACCGKDKCCTEKAPCSEYGDSKECCDENLQACCDGYGCVVPCESHFDAIGCQLAGLSLSSGSVETVSPCNFDKRLWRILRPDEVPTDGLEAKDPKASKTVLSHVNCGSLKGYASQYISTTASYEVAKHYKAMGKKKGLTGLRIAEIDLDALPKHCKLEIVDLTTEENRDKYLGNAVCKNFAKASCEVLLACDVPIPCHVVDSPEDKISLKNSGEL